MLSPAIKEGGMLRLPFHVLILLLTFGSSVMADTTVCRNENDCTVISGDIIRKLTNEELQNRWRQQSLDKLRDVDCRFSADQTRCHGLAAQLRALFVRAP